jgi:FAD/FMN-containing dehydrogenase
MTSIAPETLDRLREVVGAGGYLEDPADTGPYLTDWRRLYTGVTPMVLRPRTTEEVSRLVAICATARIGIVPQGGNTGMMAGAVPDADGAQVVISLARMNRIRDLDTLDFTLTVDAGCVLSQVRDAARDADRLFPLSLAAEGSCQIGGNLATNAGGTAVLRYGNARDLVLGLEVVLPDGRVWNGLRRLRKDNTGYDLHQLFLGSEGTLGIITGAVLKLFPLPRETATSLAVVRDPQAATRLLARARETGGDDVVTFEYLGRGCLDLVFEHVAGCDDPFDRRHEHYVLMELASPRTDSGVGDAAQAILAEAMDSGAVTDAVIAASGSQAAALWRLRESVPEANSLTGACIRHDVSVSVSRVAEFLAAGSKLAAEACPGVRLSSFGHLGDGNVHFNLVCPPGLAPDAFLAMAPELTRRIHDLVVSMDGSFSAEHGIGRLKRQEMSRYRGGVELDLMRAVKRALDPEGVMNPGKVI